MYSTMKKTDPGISYISTMASLQRPNGRPKSLIYVLTRSVDRNNHAVILKEISNFTFPHLKVLDVGENNIESVEGLKNMWAPFL